MWTKLAALVACLLANQQCLLAEDVSASAAAPGGASSNPTITSDSGFRKPIETNLPIATGTPPPGSIVHENAPIIGGAAPHPPPPGGASTSFGLSGKISPKMPMRGSSSFIGDRRPTNFGTGNSDSSTVGVGSGAAGVATGLGTGTPGPLNATFTSIALAGGGVTNPPSAHFSPNFNAAGGMMSSSSSGSSFSSSLPMVETKHNDSNNPISTGAHNVQTISGSGGSSSVVSGLNPSSAFPGATGNPSGINSNMAATSQASSDHRSVGDIHPPSVRTGI